MSEARFVRSSNRYGTAWLHVLRVSSAASVFLCAVLLAGSLATIATVPRIDTYSLRLWMLGAGIPLLGFAMTTSVVALQRLLKAVPFLDTRRLRERLYFVATVGVMVLLPAAMLGLRWASASPGNEMPVRIVEALALLMVALLLLRNASDAGSMEAVPGDRGAVDPQPERLPERSMSSIR